MSSCDQVAGPSFFESTAIEVDEPWELPEADPVLLMILCDLSNQHPGGRGDDCVQHLHSLETGGADKIVNFPDKISLLVIVAPGLPLVHVRLPVVVVELKSVVVELPHCRFSHIGSRSPVCNSSQNFLESQKLHSSSIGRRASTLDFDFEP